MSATRLSSFVPFLIFMQGYFCSIYFCTTIRNRQGRTDCFPAFKVICSFSKQLTFKTMIMIMWLPSKCCKLLPKRNNCIIAKGMANHLQLAAPPQPLLLELQHLVRKTTHSLLLPSEIFAGNSDIFPKDLCCVWWPQASLAYLLSNVWTPTQKLHGKSNWKCLVSPANVIFS